MERAYPRITIYSRTWCGHSMMVKRWFDRQQIPYTDIDVNKDAQAAQYVRELNEGYESVPTILFDGMHVATEPSIAELERLLGL